MQKKVNTSLIQLSLDLHLILQQSVLTSMETENHLLIPDVQRLLVGVLHLLFVFSYRLLSSTGSVFNLKRPSLMFRMHAAVGLPEPRCYQLYCLSECLGEAAERITIPIPTAKTNENCKLIH